MVYVQAGLAVVSILMSLFGSKKASSAAKRQGKKLSAAEQDVTAEKIDQLFRQERTLAGQTRALTVGSGVKANVGSPLTILAEQARAFGRERGIVAKVGATKAQAALQGGRDVASIARYQGFGSAAQSASNIFGLFRQPKGI